MARGQFTKEEATATEQAFTEVFEALTKKKRLEYIIHANDIFLFIAAAGEAAPGEAAPGEAAPGEADTG